jgi:hypothetical protein
MKLSAARISMDQWQGCARIISSRDAHGLAKGRSMQGLSAAGAWNYQQGGYAWINDWGVQVLSADEVCNYAAAKLCMDQWQGCARISTAGVGVLCSHQQQGCVWTIKSRGMQGLSAAGMCKNPHQQRYAIISTGVCMGYQQQGLQRLSAAVVYKVIRKVQQLLAVKVCKSYQQHNGVMAFSSRILQGIIISSVRIISDKMC